MNFVEPALPVIGYEPDALQVDDSVQLCGIAWSSSDGPLMLGPPLEAPEGQICVAFAGAVCAQAGAPPPPEAVGRWTGEGVVVEVRSDGYARVIRDGQPPMEGQLRFVGASAQLQLCSDVLVLPIAVVAGVGLAWDGASMVLAAKDWDEQALAAERVRREAAVERSRSRSSGRSRSHDFDFD